MPALKLEAPPFAVNDIVTLASCGFSKRGIAQHFFVALSTFNRWLEEHPELEDAFQIGRERERQALHNMLYKAAMEKGDKIAAIFLLKARHGYREGDTQEQVNQVAINFTLPAAMKPEDFALAKVIDANPRVESKQLPSEAACDTRRV